MRYWYIEKSISVFENLVLTIADWTISLKTHENAGFIYLPSSSIALVLDSILNMFGRLKRNTLWPGRNLKCSCFPYISLWLHLRSCNMLRLSFKCFSIVLITSLFMRLKLNSLSNAHSMRKCLMQLQLGKCAQKVSWKFQQEVYSNYNLYTNNNKNSEIVYHFIYFVELWKQWVWTKVWRMREFDIPNVDNTVFHNVKI